MNFRSLTTILIIVGIIGFICFSSLNGLEVGNYKFESIQESIKLGLDIEGGVVLVYEAETDLTGTELKSLMDQTRAVMERRINEMGLTEPKISIVDKNRIRIELPGVADAQEAIKQVGTTAQLLFVVVEEGQIALEGMAYTPELGEVALTGERVKGSQFTTDDKGKPAVSLAFDSEGKELFAAATKKAALAGGSQIAIILDNEIISSPRASQTIADGKAIITGQFSIDEASTLANLIRGGALPVELEEIQSSIIGPTLGKDALDSSINAAKIGFILVIAFMLLYYRIPGFVASIALVLYASLILLLMVGLGATLTLPGVAGIVLSVGMAVDANVIIFERLKEEIRDGKTIRASLESGFSKALRTIMDSNVTTLIAAVVLYNFGTGPIKGFAVTLMIGIVTSMFTAIIITKTLLKSFVKIKGLSNPKMYGA